MKKPILATLGIAGACAACCAIPIVLPVLSGLSVAGLLSFDGIRAALTPSVLAAVAGAAVALAVGAGLWISRRRQTAPACAMPVDGKSSGCGCAS